MYLSLQSSCWRTKLTFSPSSENILRGSLAALFRYLIGHILRVRPERLGKAWRIEDSSVASRKASGLLRHTPPPRVGGHPSPRVVDILRRRSIRSSSSSILAGAVDLQPALPVPLELVSCALGLHSARGFIHSRQQNSLNQAPNRRAYSRESRRTEKAPSSVCHSTFSRPVLLRSRSRERTGHKPSRCPTIWPMEHRRRCSWLACVFALALEE